MRNITVAKNKLKKISHKLSDKKLSVVSLCRYLNKEFRNLSVKFRPKKGDFFSIAGEFAGDVRYDNELRYNVDITWDKNQKYFIPTKDFYHQLLLTMIHEFRHGYQERRRNNKEIMPWFRHPKFQHPKKDIVEEVNYLSDYDELDAHAYEAAYELKHRKSKRSWVVNRYRKNLAIHNPKLFNKFLKKVYLFSHK
jgi:hypothetical protein